MKAVFIFIGFLIISQCNESKKEMEFWVGHIDPENAYKSLGFETCQDTIKHLYHHRASRKEERAGYHGGNRAIKLHIDERFDSHEFKDSGYLTFRFIMNCKGEVGRFIVEEVDLSFNESSFDKKLVKELLEITSSMDNWRPLCFHDENKDVYMFVTYKIVNGQIMEILP